MIVAAGDLQGLAHAMDRVVLEMPDAEREGLAELASTRWPSIVCVCSTRSFRRQTHERLVDRVRGRFLARIVDPSASPVGLPPTALDATTGMTTV